MLPRTKRLSTEKFNIVLNKGKRSHSPFFVLQTTDKNEDTRVSVVVPKKVSKTAAERNKIRRVIYNTMRPMFPKIVKGAHVIIFIKQKEIINSNTNTNKEIETAFEKSGILR